MTIKYGSNMPAKNGYGQNGFTGASSDTARSANSHPLSVNNEDTDKVLATIREKGGVSASLTHEKLRDVSGSRQTSFGMRPSTRQQVQRCPARSTSTATRRRSRDANRAERQQFIDLVIVGVLPRTLPQWAEPHCPTELALRMTADKTLPWQIPDAALLWTTEGDTDDDRTD